jgi:hypothetical protein
MRFTSDLHNNFNKYRYVLHLVNTVPVGKSGDRRKKWPETNVLKINKMEEPYIFKK